MQNDEVRNVDRRQKHKSQESCFPKAQGEDSSPANNFFMQLRCNLNFCHPVIKYIWIMHYLGGDCDNYGKSLKGWAPHSLVFNTFSFICIFTKPQDQNGRKRWYICSIFSCIELVPRIGRFEYSQWSDMVPFL